MFYWIKIIRLSQGTRQKNKQDAKEFEKFANSKPRRQKKNTTMGKKIRTKNHLKVYIINKS